MKTTRGNPDHPNKNEPNFRRFEAHLIKLTEVFPLPLIVDPAPIACMTFRSRLYDAANFILDERNAVRTLLDVARFATIWAKVKVTMSRTHITFAPPGLLSSPVGEVVPSATPLRALDSPSEEQLSALAGAYAVGALTEPTLLTNVAKLPELPFGVVCEARPDGTHIMM